MVTRAGAAFPVGGVAFPLALTSKGEIPVHLGRAMVAPLMSLLPEGIAFGLCRGFDASLVGCFASRCSGVGLAT